MTGLPLQTTPGWLAILVAMGCDGQLSPGPPEGPDEAVVVEVRVTPMPPPPRYTRPLPPDSTALSRPVAWYASRLCDGDVGLRDGWLAAVQEAASTMDPADLGATFGPHLGSCAAEDTCAWLVSVATSDPSPAVRAVAWQGLASCDEARPHLTQAPPRAVIRWYEQHQEVLDYPPQLERAIVQLARTDPTGLLLGAGVLGSFVDPRAESVLLRLEEDETDPQVAEALLQALVDQQGPQAASLHGLYCAMDSTAPTCDELLWSYQRPLRASLQRAPLSVLVRRTDLPTEVLWRALPARRGRLLAELSSCAADPDLRMSAVYGMSTGLDHCLYGLASVDRPAAVSAAARMPTSDAGSLSETLVDHPDLAVVEEQLELAGLLIPGERSEPPELQAVTAADLLVARGHARAITHATPGLSYQDLADLAELASPALDGVVFWTSSPGHSGAWLHAWMDGRRHTVALEGQVVDEHAVAAMVDLLNALLEHRASEERFAAVEARRQVGWLPLVVALGPQAGFQVATDQGLISPAVPQPPPGETLLDLLGRDTAVP